jgi:hypothetical protein
MKHLHTVYLGHLNPVLGFIHHGGGRAEGFWLLAMLALGVLVVVMIATMDKSK